MPIVVWTLAAWLAGTAAAPFSSSSTKAPPAVMSASLVDAVTELMKTQRECARVLVMPVDDPDEPRRLEVERALVRVLRDRAREDVVTPMQVRGLVENAMGADVNARSVAAFVPDHLLQSAVVGDAARPVLQLRLVLVETGEILGASSIGIGIGIGGDAGVGGGAPSTVRGAVALALDQISEGVEARGQPLRTQRLAVVVEAADGPARAERLDTFFETELLRGLKERGFLVVERARLAAVIDELGRGQLIGDDDAPRLGKLVGAQALVIGRVADVGTSFVFSARVVDGEDGRVRGASSVSFPREGLVSLAAVETRTPGEAAIRSALAPGWGQAYNQQTAKSVVFAAGGYGGAIATVVLGVWTGLSYAAYRDATPSPGESRLATDARLTDMLARSNGLLLGTAVVCGATSAVWAAGIVDAALDATPSSP